MWCVLRTEEQNKQTLIEQTQTNLQQSSQKINNLETGKVYVVLDYNKELL